MNNPAAILQIVPRAPGTQDGVGDYALTVARQIRELFSYETIFLANEEVPNSAQADDFQILSPLDPVARNNFPGKDFQHVILHYVNYGYQDRGIPFRLASILTGIRRRMSGRFLTIFHEISASGPPWKSAFWLRPFQLQIAKSIGRLSDGCIVSSDTMFNQLKRLVPHAKVIVRPVFSNFGEPMLTAAQLTNRSPHRWIICGGTLLVQRSMQSFPEMINGVPEHFRPRELCVMGGQPNSVVHELLRSLEGIQTDYRPQIAGSDASTILSQSSFAWLDYFHRTDVPAAVVLKSTAFAAACAHGVVPVFPHPGSVISIETDRLPGPYFVDANNAQFPEDIARVAMDIYQWYQRHAASENLVRGIALALGITSNGRKS